MSVEIAPPSRHRNGLLPLVDLGSRAFEELCLDIVEEIFPNLVVRASLKRTSGVEQFGVDVEGFDVEGEPAVLVSAKCYHRVNAWDFRIWLKDFTDHLDGHWAGRRIQHFVLAVSHECNDDSMNAAARDLVRELKDRGIAFHLWNTHKISQSLRRQPHLVDRYFGRYWIEAISGGAEVAPASTLQSSVLGLGQPSVAAAGILQQAVAQVEGLLAGPVNAAMTAALEAALKSMRAGRYAELERWVEEARAQSSLWVALDPKAKARALRAIAMLRLRDSDTEAAAKLLDEADDMSPATDVSSRALLKRATDSVDEALAMLREPLAPRERETQAAILIEAGRLQEAEDTIAKASGEAISAEVLRLRSIVSLLRGRMREAIADAGSAVERAPGELAPLLARATVRLFSALADGVHVQIGGAPEPINPGLVRQGKVARNELARAADEFESALQHAEGRPKSDIEIWRLAALLLNPDRFEEGVAVAHGLLDRPLPDPIAVAWAFHFGLIERFGRLKKTYGRVLREGQGTPGHLVVLALLCAGSSHPQRGAGQIRRHAWRFPDAADFLERWRARFGDNKARGAEGDFPKVVRSAVRSKDNSKLLGLAIAQNANVELILATGEFLLQQQAWDDLVKLRSPLLAIATVRAVEVAALGALRSGSSWECLAILEEGARSFENGELPRSLVHLRIAANEELGRHEPVIADLLSLRRDGAYSDEAGH